MKDGQLDEVFIDELLDKAAEAGYSELHLEVGNPPCVRFRGAYTLEKLLPYEILQRSTVQRLLYDVMTDEQIMELEDVGTLIFCYLAQRIGRFNVHVLYHEGNPEATFHVVPNGK